jgi:hypothetical protein
MYSEGKFTEVNPVDDMAEQATPTSAMVALPRAAKSAEEFVELAKAGAFGSHEDKVRFVDASGKEEWR